MEEQINLYRLSWYSLQCIKYSTHNYLIFPGIRLSFCLFRLKIEGHLIHRSKLRRVQKQVEGKTGIKLFLQGFDPFPPYTAMGLL